MIRIVLDTNVLVSGMINPYGAPGRIVDLIREQQIELAVDDRILTEYATVLKRPKFRRYFSKREVRDIMLFLQENTIYLVPGESVAGLPDPDDAVFLDLALAANAPLVTGNLNHYPENLCRSVRIMTPASCLKNLF